MKKFQLNDLGFPLVLSPTADDFDLLAWAKESKGEIRELLNKHGAILFRGFDIETVEQFEKFVALATTDECVEYREAATPRSHVNGNVFTSTEYPSAETIFFHNENSHTTTWPLYLAFYCKIPSESGGATPLTNCRKIYQDMPAELIEKFESKKVLYARNFGYGVGIDWLKGFPVNNKEEMDEYCEQFDMTSQWREGQKLNITYKRWATLKHPVTDEKVWFNHGTFFNFFSLTKDTQSLISQYIGKENTPSDTSYGDGSPIDEATIEQLKMLYVKHSVSIAYHKNDVLLIDNMLVAHGREPYTGERKVFVTMTKNINCEQFAY
jgi:alpha-ketoglutarate-dependent taurine dioxygenase